MKSITNNWNLKLTSLVLAVALWTHVRGEVNPWETATFKVRLRVEAPPKMVLLNAAKLPSTVNVLVRAPRLTLREMKGVALPNPLSPTEEAVKIAPSEVSAFLSFTRQQTGEQNVPIKAVATRPDVEVQAVKPADFEVVLDQAASLRLRLQPRFSPAPPAGFRLENVDVQPASGQVWGPSRLLARIVRAEVRLHGQAFAVGAAQEESAPIVVVDAAGAEVAGVRIEPAIAQVRARLREEVATRRLRIIPSVQGAPAPGYRIAGVEATPDSLVVRGPLRKLKPSLPVAIDVAGAGASFSRRAAVALPPGTTTLNRPRVTVRVRVERLRATQPSTAATPGATPNNQPIQPAPAPSEAPASETLPPPAPAPE